MPNQKIKYCLLFIIPVILLLPRLVLAEGLLDDPQLMNCIKEGDCTLLDVTILLSNAIRFFLGIIGAVALLYFVWGGVQWVISGGNAERVRRGQQIMINTSMALVVAFGSYILVSFIINNLLGVKTPYQVSSETALINQDVMPIENTYYVRNLCPNNFNDIVLTSINSYPITIS